MVASKAGRVSVTGQHRKKGNWKTSLEIPAPDPSQGIKFSNPPKSDTQKLKSGDKANKEAISMYIKIAGTKRRMEKLDVKGQTGLLGSTQLVLGNEEKAYWEFIG